MLAIMLIKVVNENTCGCIAYSQGEIEARKNLKKRGQKNCVAFKCPSKNFLINFFGCFL